MKWGTLYPASYVNVLYNAVCRNLAAPFRFVCLTDDGTGLLPGIEALPLPAFGLPEPLWYAKGVWPKLGIYQPGLNGLTGRCLFIDLDMMICGRLEPFFEFAAPFAAIDTGANWRARHAGAAPEAGTGLFAFDFGAEPQILARFMADPEKAIAAYGTEQAFVQATARSMAFWPHGWVISFKRHLCQPVGLDLFLPPKSPPPDAKVIAFHGSPRPIDLIRPGRHRWATLPHSGRGPVPWLVDYWRENG